MGFVEFKTTCNCKLFYTPHPFIQTKNSGSTSSQVQEFAHSTKSAKFIEMEEIEHSAERLVEMYANIKASKGNKRKGGTFIRFAKDLRCTSRGKMSLKIIFSSQRCR